MPVVPAYRPRPGLERGITLLEILIAVLVLSLGLLGVAGLQLIGLKNGQQSYQRSQVTTLAYEIADRMRANRAAAISGSYQFTTSNLPTTAPAKDCSAAAVTCSGSELAAWELYDWFGHVRAALNSNASASIQCDSAFGCGAGRVQTITLNWDEDKTGALSSFVVSVTP